MKRFHKLLGAEGEKHAERYLKNLGYRFVCRNYRTARGEIDLIFLDGEDLVFAEVKTMTEETVPTFGEPFRKITPDKQRRLTLTAAAFLAAHTAKFSQCCPRFDAVEVVFCRDRVRITHRKHAFEARTGFQHKKLF